MTTVLIPPQKVAIADIQWKDQFTMVRAEMNKDAIKACAERWKEGKGNPFVDAPEPIKLFVDADNKYWVGDGRHRIAGADDAGRTHVDAIVEDGTKMDALTYALKCNTENGTSFTPRDNTLRIKKAHAVNAGWSDTKMAKELKIPLSTVSRVRLKLVSKDTQVSKEVAKEAAKAAAAPAPKTKREASETQAALKNAVRAKSVKAKPDPKPKAENKPEPKGEARVTDVAGSHGKEVQAALANLARIDDEIQKLISALVKQFDLRNEITGEGVNDKSHYSAIVSNMDLLITEWKTWKKDQ